MSRQLTSNVQPKIFISLLTEKSIYQEFEPMFPWHPLATFSRSKIKGAESKELPCHSYTTENLSSNPWFPPSLWARFSCLSIHRPKSLVFWVSSFDDIPPCHMLRQSSIISLRLPQTLLPLIFSTGTIVSNVYLLNITAYKVQLS